LKHLTAFILIITLFAFQFSELLVYISFKMNQDYIAKNLCIEKDVEGSTCKGCCQLKKRMNEQQESKKDLPPEMSGKQNIDIINQSAICWFIYFPDSEDVFGVEDDHYFFGITNQIFHPPKV